MDTYCDYCWSYWYESEFSDPPVFEHPNSDDANEPDVLRYIEPEHPPHKSPGVEFRAGQEPVQAMMRRSTYTPTTKGAMMHPP